MALIMYVIDSICIILFVLGFVGNILGLIVFSSRRFRCCSTYASLALTSFSINLICIIRYSLLLHSTTRRWLSNHIVSVHWLTCKIFRLSSSFRVLAAWVTVFWVIERFFYVSSRLHYWVKQRDKVKCLERYKFALMILIATIMIIIVSGPTVIFSAPRIISSNTSYSSLQCTFDSAHVSPKWFHYFVDLKFGFNYYTIRCLLSELVPSFFVACFNITIVACILRTTARVRRQQHHHHNRFTMSMVTGTTSKIPQSSPLPAMDTSQQQQGLITSWSIITAHTSTVPFGKMSWMNIILILHSFLFFLSSSVTSLVFFSTMDIILSHWVSVIILANCSLNFYVYCLSGRQFRAELRRIARRYVRHIHKAFVRRRQQDHRRRSPIPVGRDSVNPLAPLPVQQQQQQQQQYRRILSPLYIRTSPIHQFVKH